MNPSVRKPIITQALLAVAADANLGLDTAIESFNGWLKFRVATWFKHWDDETVAYRRLRWTPDQLEYVMERARDQAAALLLPNLEPWRVGRNWREFPTYAANVVDTVCLGLVLLAEEPCKIDR